MPQHIVLGDNVVVFPNSRVIMAEPQPQSEFPMLNEVEAYWDALRDGRDVPSRGDIDPRGLERALAHAFVIECQPGALARLRLSGDVLNQMMGMDLRSMPLHALFDPDDRAQLDTMIEEVFAVPQALRLTLRGASAKSNVFGGMLLLPLRDDFGKITRALGALEFLGDAGPAPARLRINGHQPRAVKASPSYDAPAEQTSEQGFAEMYDTFIQRKGPGTSRPTLRVVPSED